MVRQTYEIIDGVRRAKAAQLAGHETIWALVYGRETEQKIPIPDLLSPKKVIDLTTPRELQRWVNIQEAMMSEPDLLSPIIVRRRAVGIPIAEVAVIGLP